jgi:hypothetical protein
MLSLVLGMILFSTPVWAELDSRSGVQPAQSHQPVILHEVQPPGAESMSIYPDNLPTASFKLGDLILKSGRERVDGSRKIANSHSPFNTISADEFQDHDARSAGIPLWRW